MADDRKYFLLVIPEDETNEPYLVGPFQNRDGAEGYGEALGESRIFAVDTDWTTEPLRIEAP